MSTLVDGPAVKIAERLRLERETRGWSLAEVASRSGVSKAMLSKVERLEASPTATVLIRLAAAFDLTLGALVTLAEGSHGLLVRSSEQPLWQDPATGYLRRQLFSRPDHPLELVRVELPPGARVGLPASSYTLLRQVVWVLSGALVICEGTARHELCAGDTLGFGPPSDTTFANESAQPCTYLVAVTRS